MWSQSQPQQTNAAQLNESEGSGWDVVMYVKVTPGAGMRRRRLWPAPAPPAELNESSQGLLRNLQSDSEVWVRKQHMHKAMHFLHKAAI